MMTAVKVAMATVEAIMKKKAQEVQVQALARSGSESIQTVKMTAMTVGQRVLGRPPL